MKKNVEDLIIYKQFLELIYYMENICEKYPKSEKNSLVSTIKNVTYESLKDVIKAFKVYEKDNKLKYLNDLDSNLKFLKVLIRISYRKKYINKKNYEAWSRKIANIGNLLGGWILSCVKA